MYNEVDISIDKTNVVSRALTAVLKIRYFRKAEFQEK